MVFRVRGCTEDILSEVLICREGWASLSGKIHLWRVPRWRVLHQRLVQSYHQILVLAFAETSVALLYSRRTKNWGS